MKFSLLNLWLVVGLVFASGCRTVNAEKSAANATVKRVEFRLGTNAAVVVSDPHDTSWKKLAFKSGDTELTIDGYRSTVNEGGSGRSAGSGQSGTLRIASCSLNALDGASTCSTTGSTRCSRSPDGILGWGDSDKYPSTSPILPSNGSTTVRLVPAQ